ncbi:response regulator [Solidesulfovibrio magneticus]|nr:response regulator [Solidesulfovibrio magneticus]
MPVVSLFHGAFCQEKAVADALAAAANLTVVTDDACIRQAGERSGLGPAAVARAFAAKVSVFDRFTHETNQALAWLRLVLAERLAENDALLLVGGCALLPPRAIGHILRACLIADAPARRRLAAEAGHDAQSARKLLAAADADRVALAARATGSADPWDPMLFDMVLPMDKLPLAAAVDCLVGHLGDAAVQPTEATRAAAADFLLAAKVQTALAAKGHDVRVAAHDGLVSLTIERKVLLLSSLERELRAIAAAVPGVADVLVKVGKGFYQSDIYRRADFDMPSRVLLVDDERDFVQTLSDRLSLRQIGVHVVFDGETALAAVAGEAPDVLVLDLRLPGINGLEALRRAKAARPDLEVVVLSGAAGPAERQACLALGAFAVLDKPADVDALAEVLRQAGKKARANQSAAATGA